MKQKGKNVSPMSNEGRNAYVIEHITAALLELLREKPMEDISISELCEYAGIGRASFYRNFNSKEDILRAYLSRLLYEWEDQLGDEEKRDLGRRLHAIFAYFEAQREFYGLLNRRGLVYLLKDTIIEFYGLSPEDPKEAAYAKAFAAYALYGWIEVWFQRGMKESAQEIEAMFRGVSLGQ